MTASGAGISWKKNQKPYYRMRRKNRRRSLALRAGDNELALVTLNAQTLARNALRAALRCVLSFHRHTRLPT